MTNYFIPDMSCGHCKATIEKTVLGLDPDATLAFDIPARTLVVQTSHNDASLLTALDAAGYPATAV
jgi:copper chaperone